MPKQLGYRRGKNPAAVINACCGRMARRIAKAIGYEAKPPARSSRCGHWWFTLSYWNKEAEMGDDNQWIMWPELVEALDDLAA